VYVVKSMKLAGYLMQQGFVLLKLDDDRNGTGRKVFLFKQSDELMKAIHKYQKGE
jgi:hypothetical protein